MPGNRLKIDVDKAKVLAAGGTAVDADMIDATPDEIKRAQKKEEMMQAKLKKAAEVRQFVESVSNTKVEPEIFKNFAKVPTTNNDILKVLQEWDDNGYEFVMFIPVPMGSYNYVILRKKSGKDKDK